VTTIVVGFTNAGVPAIGLSPTIRIRRTDTQALVVTDVVMTAEQGDGAYSYDFAPVDGLDYSIRVDGTATLPDAERYAFGSLSGAEEARIETDIPAILVDTGTTIPAQITALNDLSIADVQAALTAQGYSTTMAADLAVAVLEIARIHQMHGLDLANPLTITDTSRTVGTIVQAITDALGSTVVTRTA